MCQRFKVSRSNLPEYAGLTAGLGRSKTKTEIAKIGRWLGRLALHQLKDGLIQTRSGEAAVFVWRDIGRTIRFKPAPFHRPQVGRMNPVSVHQFLHFAVLGKQRDRGHRPIGQHALQIFCQGEASTLDFCSRFKIAMLWLLYKFLNCGFHGAQNQRRSRQADHFKGAYRLMQLLPRNTQLTRIKCGQVRTACRLSISDETFKRLVGAFERLAELV